MHSTYTEGFSHRLRILLALAAGSFAVLALLAQRHSHHSWDVAVTQVVQSMDFPGFSSLMIGVSIVGNGWVPVLIVVLFSLGLLRMCLRTEGIICMAGVGLGFSINRLLKMLIGRPRPAESLVEVYTDYGSESFPSGHVVFFVTFFGFLLFLGFAQVGNRLIRKVLLASLAALIVLVGLSRVYLGAHWPSDVIGAYLFGGVWLAVMIKMYQHSKSTHSD